MYLHMLLKLIKKISFTAPHCMNFNWSQANCQAILTNLALVSLRHSFIALFASKIMSFLQYTTSLPSFHIKEQNRLEISSLEQL